MTSMHSEANDAWHLAMVVADDKFYAKYHRQEVDDRAAQLEVVTARRQLTNCPSKTSTNNTEMIVTKNTLNQLHTTLKPSMQHIRIGTAIMTTECMDHNEREV